MPITDKRKLAESDSGTEMTKNINNKNFKFSPFFIFLILSLSLSSLTAFLCSLSAPLVIYLSLSYYKFPLDMFIIVRIIYILYKIFCTQKKNIYGEMTVQIKVLMKESSLLFFQLPVFILKNRDKILKLKSWYLYEMETQKKVRTSGAISVI